MINSSTSAIRDDLVQVQEKLKRARSQWDLMETERKAREEKIAKAQADALAKVEAAARARIPLPTPTPVTPTNENGHESLFGSGKGRGRGRPRGRGRGRGGLRETVLARTPSVQDASATEDGHVNDSPGPSTPTPKSSVKSTPTTPTQSSPTKASITGSNTLPVPNINTSEPVNISVSM